MAQLQVHTKHNNNFEEVAHCPFCGIQTIGKWNRGHQYPHLETISACKHFVGFVQGYKNPAAHYEGPGELLEA